MSTFYPLIIAELIIIIFVIGFQIFHSVKTYLNINKLAGIFIQPLLVRNGYVDRKFLETPDSIEANLVHSPGEDEPIHQNHQFARIALTETAGENEIILRMKKAINTYLLNNFGAAVNFSIIRDIVDRETDAKDEEISQSVPTPLYLGLAATMVGIIFGLLAMPDIDGSNFAEGVNRLIDGVRIAMTASLTGLLCTTVLSSFFYKKAKRQALLLKNSQLSYMQAKLLPELIKAEETGVSGLKASLDHFAREAAVITGNVHRSALQTGENLRVQDSIIARLERLNMTKVSRANLEMFSLLEKNMDAFQSFSGYLAGMEEIASNLKDFASRTSQIDKISGQIEATLSESKDLVRFLNTHFEKIEHAGTAALKAVDLSDSYFRESVDLLKERTRVSVETLFSISDKTESELKETLDQITARITEATNNHIEEFMAAYSQAVPRFRNLDYLQPIQEMLVSKSESFLHQSEKSNQAILTVLEELSRKMPGISHPANNSLELAVRELTALLAANNPVQQSVRKPWQETLETGLRIAAWTSAIVVCTLMIIHWMKLI
jgi:hypothetical protein